MSGFKQEILISRAQAWKIIQTSAKNQKQNLKFFYIMLIRWWCPKKRKILLSQFFFLKYRIQSSGIKDIFSWRRKLSSKKECLKIIFLQCSISVPVCLNKKFHSDVPHINLDAEIKLNLVSGKCYPLLIHISLVPRWQYPLSLLLFLDPQQSTSSFATVAGNF